jgi:hypothetical protein
MTAPAALALDMLLVHGGNRRRSLLRQVLPAMYAELLD